MVRPDRHTHYFWRGMTGETRPLFMERQDRTDTPTIAGKVRRDRLAHYFWNGKTGQTRLLLPKRPDGTDTPTIYWDVRPDIHAHNFWMGWKSTERVHCHYFLLCKHDRHVHYICRGMRDRIAHSVTRGKSGQHFYSYIPAFWNSFTRRLFHGNNVFSFQLPSEVMQDIDEYSSKNKYGHKAGFSFAVDALWTIALGR